MGDIVCPLNFGRYENGILFCRPTGRLTPELAECMSDCHEAHRRLLGRSYDMFYDFRGLSGEELNFEKIHNLAAKRSKSAAEGGTCKIAILVTSPHAFGLARMYQSLITSKNINIKISSDPSELAEFLGIDEVLLG